ncbi:Myb-like dna-binding protein [Globisporangium polare]
MSTPSSNGIERGVWSGEEHDKFLVALKMYPKGPWKTIAAQIGTRSARQVQTHAQKYYEKVARRVRGLRKDRKKLARPEHRLDDDMVTLCKVATENDGAGARIGPIRNGLNAVAAIPREVFAARQEPLGADQVSDAAFEAPYRHDRRDSIESLLEEDDDEEMDMELAPSEFTDSDDSDSLLGFDDEHLNFLIEILDKSSCMSDGASSD